MPTPKKRYNIFLDSLFTARRAQGNRLLTPAEIYAMKPGEAATGEAAREWLRAVQCYQTTEMKLSTFGGRAK